MAKDDMKYKEESLEQKEAFEIYYSLGEKREIKHVSPKVGKTTRTLYEWSRRFNWQERVQQREIEIGKKLAEKHIDIIVNEKAKMRKLVEAGLYETSKAIKEGMLVPKNWADVERIIKLNLLLLGEAENISKVEGQASISEEDRMALKDLSESLKANSKTVKF